MDSERHDKPEQGRDDDALGVVDFVLGEGSVRAREGLRAAVATDLELALEVAETRALIEDMRSLRVPTSGRVLRNLEREFVWRARLRGRDVDAFASRWEVWVKIAAVALIWLLVSEALFLGRARSNRGPQWQAETMALAPAERSSGPRMRFADADGPPAALELPVTAPEFRNAWLALVSRPLPHDFANWLSAENVLARARVAARLRSSPQLRARWRQQSGAADVETRVSALAREVAERARTALAGGAPEPEDLAFALRALLASGSDAEIGPYRRVVRDIRNELVARVGALADGPRATVLAALAELAVSDPGPLGALVAARADELIGAITEPHLDHTRPALLNWLQPAYRIAEAGRLLLLAPAFGADAAGAFRARLLLAAHLEERGVLQAGQETPELAAVLTYAFADLIDLPETDHRLAYWSPELMIPDFLAVSHLTWGRFPIRQGWAELQTQLRGLAGVSTPSGFRDAAALLLALCCEVAGSDLRTPRGRAIG